MSLILMDVFGLAPVLNIYALTLLCHCIIVQFVDLRYVLGYDVVSADSLFVICT